MTKYTYGDQNTQDGKKPLYIPDESGNVSLGSSAAQSGQRYAVEGFSPPAGIVGKEAVKEMQRMLGGLTVDGVWGPKTQKQYDKFVISTLRDKEAPTTSNDTNLLGYVEDLYQLSLGVGKSDRGNYVMRGYDPPAGIRSAEDVRAFQESNGLDVDGVWGPRTQSRYDLLQAQSAARQAGQYDPDEVERLLNDGMRNIPGTERTADILSYSRGGELANTPVVLGRAAKGYTIPTGVYDVAATQQLLGVKADSMWGKDTDRAYKNLMSGGGQASDNGQKVADALDGLYAQVNASGLNKAQKTRAIALLETLKLYGDTEYIRKTLLGIQMAGGAEKFFTTLSGPSGYALIDMQKKERQALQTRLAQTERAIADIPLWNRWVSPTPEYQELQREKAGLQEQIGAVEVRLSEISPDWETVWDIWDWSEVDAWEKQQTALAEQAEQEPENPVMEGNESKPRYNYETSENVSRARNDSEVKAFVGTIIGEIGQEAGEQYKRGQELTTAKAVAFVIMNCLHYNDGGYQQYNTITEVAKRYFGGFNGNGMDSFSAYLEGDYSKFAKLQNTSEKYARERIAPVYDAIMKTVLPILDGVDDEDFTKGALHIFSPERQMKLGRDIPKWVSTDNKVDVDSLEGYDLEIYY